jgi:hypothetical protein
LISSSAEEVAGFEEMIFGGGFRFEAVFLLVFRDLETGGVESFRTDSSESLSSCMATLRFLGAAADDGLGGLIFVVADFANGGEGSCFVMSKVSRVFRLAGDDA